MEATRVRLSSTGEWVTAVLFFAGTLLLGLLIVRELRGVSRALDAGTEPAAAASTAIPADAVSVPTLLVDPTHEIRVGDRAIDALAHLGGSVTLMKRTSERSPPASYTVLRA
jgi:hypothetical protein